MKARWADASRVERVPLVAALAEPLVLFAGRPAAEGTADARRLRGGLLLLLSLAIWNDDPIVSDRTHAAIMTSFPVDISLRWCVSLTPVRRTKGEALFQASHPRGLLLADFPKTITVFQSFAANVRFALCYGV
jgi:hypothetical protein